MYKSLFLFYYSLCECLGLMASVLWKNDLNIDLNSMMQLKMFADLQSHNDKALLPSQFRSLVIDREIISNFTTDTIVYITFNTRTNVIRGPGIEIEVLQTSEFSSICPLPTDLNIQKVQFVEQPYPKTQVIYSYNIHAHQIKNNIQ